MTEEELFYHREEERILFERLGREYYKSPGSIKQSILSVMTDSDIAEIVGDKRREWGLVEGEKKKAIYSYRGEGRQILEGFFLEEQEQINKLIKELQYIIKSRSGDSAGFDREDLQRAKDTIPIADIIEVLTGVKTRGSFRLIRCLFPAHKDNTPSLKIYEKTNSFYCQGCKKGGGSIDLIMNIMGCDLKTAIRQLLIFYKK